MLLPSSTDHFIDSKPRLLDQGKIENQMDAQFH
jgi:hypothetical protein